MASLSEAQGIDGGSFVQTSQPWWGFTKPRTLTKCFPLDWSCSWTSQGIRGISLVTQQRSETNYNIFNDLKNVTPRICYMSSAKTNPKM